jgi:hypothetical protein
MRNIQAAVLIFSFSFSTSALALSGKLESLTEYFPKDLGAPTNTVTPRLGIELDQDGKINKQYRYSFKGTFQSNLASKYQPENYFADLYEAYVEYKPTRKFKTIIGWNTVNWGVLDLYSPMDVVNQHTYFDPLNTQKRGAAMVDLEWKPRGWEMSAVYIPFQAKAIFPSNDSRWLPRTAINNITVPVLGQQVTAHLPPSPEYDIQNPVTDNSALNHNFGVNIVKHWESLDLHGVYFNGAASTPSFLLDVNGTFTPPNFDLSNPIILHPLYYRTQTSAIGFSSTIGDVILRGESSYIATVGSSAYNASPWMWQNGLGLEKNWDLGTTTLTQLVHYYYAKYPNAGGNLPDSGYRLFDNAGMLGFRLAINDEEYFYASVLYNFPQQGMFWIAGYSKKLTDALRWDISWRDISARKDGLLKTYDQNDHAVMDLTYFF